MEFKNKLAKYFKGVDKKDCENVLIIGAHPDDAEFMAYQIISLAYKNEKIGVHVVVLTDGANSPRSGSYSSYTGEMMIGARLEEQLNAMKVGEYSSLFMLNYTSSEIKNVDERAKDDLITIIKTLKPTSIYMHNPFDKHPTHLGALKTTMSALRSIDLSFVNKVFGCEVWQSLEWLNLEDKVSGDTSLYHEELFIPLVNCFVSQIKGGKNYDQALIGRWKANATFHDSHSVDLFSHISFMCDLTNVAKKEITLDEYVKNIINRYNNKIIEGIK